MTSAIVVPGQVLAVSTGEDDSFLRGHGTLVQQGRDDHKTSTLIATVTGTVQRVNKLVSVIPIAASLYTPATGDWVVAQITAVLLGKWKVSLTANGLSGVLPLSGVALPDKRQRLRTAQDARDMRLFLQEGDWVACEVHKTTPVLNLHIRSARYQKLENGQCLQVPPALVARKTSHTTTIHGFDVLWGCNGQVWLQRALPAGPSRDEAVVDQVHEERRLEHAATPYTVEQRQGLARLAHSIQTLQTGMRMLETESVQAVFDASVAMKLSPMEMMQASNVVKLLEATKEK